MDIDKVIGDAFKNLPPEELDRIAKLAGILVETRDRLEAANASAVDFLRAAAALYSTALHKQAEEDPTTSAEKFDEIFHRTVCMHLEVRKRNEARTTDSSQN